MWVWGPRVGSMSDIRIGGHGDQTGPLAAARARGAEAQFFLGDPQGWKGPKSA